jgi:chromate transport protein ChrA
MCRDSPADWARVVAVYLGALAAGGSLDLNAAVGAVIGYIAMFSPGIILQTGVMGPWKKLRTYEWINSCVRGVNAAAVGLVYTAVYRLWKMQSYDGHLDETRFGKESWWVVVIAAAFAGGMWFKLPAPAAIFIGGLMGLIWHGVVES